MSGMLGCQDKLDGGFWWGRISLSEGVADRASQDVEFATFCYRSLRRPASGGQGDISVEDGSRISSAHKHKGLSEIWIITEADRSRTRVLFSHEYRGESCYGISKAEDLH